MLGINQEWIRIHLDEEGGKGGGEGGLVGGNQYYQYYQSPHLATETWDKGHPDGALGSSRRMIIQTGFY